MKKYICLSLFIIAGAIIYQIKSNQEIAEVPSTKWRVYKVQNEKVVKRTPSNSELVTARIPKSRNLSKNKHLKKNSRDGRVLQGDSKQIDKYMDEGIHLQFVNEINDNWKEDLAEKILQSQRPGTDIFIKRESSIIEIKNNKGRYIEHVSIIVKKPNHLKQSYEALIDTETGKMIKTWNSILYEKKSEPFTYLD